MAKWRKWSFQTAPCVFPGVMLREHCRQNCSDRSHTATRLHLQTSAAGILEGIFEIINTTGAQAWVVYLWCSCVAEEDIAYQQTQACSLVQQCPWCGLKKKLRSCFKSPKSRIEQCNCVLKLQLACAYVCKVRPLPENFAGYSLWDLSKIEHAVQRKWIGCRFSLWPNPAYREEIF